MTSPKHGKVGVFSFIIALVSKYLSFLIAIVSLGNH